ncbi:MAG: squalene/phytoene synthase family protein [Deltaproteobacteria bacterium]|nr:squalene/phytoene synthase family protein [Deltaproteobacteria bacterium]
MIRPRTEDQRPKAQQICHQICKKSGSNFFYSFYLLGTKKRHALEAFYAFCRLVDDAVDLAPNETEAQKNLRFWRNEVEAIYAGAPMHPVSKVLKDAVAVFAIPKKYLEEIVTGCEMDLSKKSYATFAELNLYCYRVASCVGLVCIRIFGATLTEKLEQGSIALGKALQLTNIIRDIVTDLGQGRVYIPAEDLKRFGVSLSDLGGANSKNLNLIDLLYFEIERAKKFFAGAWSQFPTEKKERRKLMAAIVMGKFYESILNKIAKDPMAIFKGKVGLTRTEKINITLRTFLSRCHCERSEAISQ